MSETCNHDCSSCKSDCGKKAKSDFLESPNPASNIRRVIGVVSGKGGVGKSLVTSLLAVEASRMGLRAAVMDADITGPSIPRAFGITEKAMGSEEGLYPVKSRTGIDVMSLNLLLDNDTDPVVWRGPVIAGTVKQFWTDVIWENEDIMFIDMPPGTGDVPLTVFQSIPVDGVVVVSSPQELVGMIVEKALHMAEMMEIPVLGLVENMSYITCPDCGKVIRPFGESRLAALAEKFGVAAVSSLPIDGKIAEACDTGMIEMIEGNYLSEVLKAVLK